MMSNIGHFTLNISMAVYLIWFFPQIFLNFKRKDTEGLSLFMHGVLCFGYLCDLIYGFGLGMQWQYRIVTFSGLASLAVQHYQFGRYGLHRPSEKYSYLALNLLFLAFFIYVILSLNDTSSTRNFYDFFGMLANACWAAYMLPQIIKNYFNRSAQGLSPYFVLLGIFLNINDSTSAWTLSWDYPSKIGPLITLCGNLILISQVYFYDRKSKKNWQLATDR